MSAINYWKVSLGKILTVFELQYPYLLREMNDTALRPLLPLTVIGTVIVILILEIKIPEHNKVQSQGSKADTPPAEPTLGAQLVFRSLLRRLGAC